MKAHARKKQSGSVTEIVPEGTPTEVVEHRLTDEELVCSSCGSKMEEMAKRSTGACTGSGKMSTIVNFGVQATGARTFSRTILEF